MPSPVVYFHERLFAFKAVVGGFRHACIITAAPGFGGLAVSQPENAHEKVKRNWSDTIGSNRAIRGAHIASSIPRQRYVFVRGRGASPCRATAITREHCWRPPQI